MKKSKKEKVDTKSIVPECVDIEIPDISMYEMIKRVSINHKDAPAYDYLGKKVSFSEFINQCDQCAKAFVKAGICAGDIVTVCMPNTPEAVICIYSLNKIGAVSNMIHPLSAENEISMYVNSVNSKMLVVIDLFAEKIGNIIDETGLETVITVSASDSMSKLMKIGYSLTTKKPNIPKDSRFITWAEFINKGNSYQKEIKSISEGDIPAVILHSGGTTGVPKEVVLSNRNFNALSIQAKTELFDITVGDSSLAILPVFHAFGLGVCIHITMSCGACSILVPRFEAKKFASLMKKNKPTMLLGVPTLYEALMNAKGSDKLDLSYIKYIISGGDILSSAFEDRFNDYLSKQNAKVKVIQGYGLSECLGATCFAARENYKKGSIGKPFIGNRYCIVTPGTQDVLPSNTDGEICISGPTIMMGYRNNEKETNEVLQIHSDGRIWLHTGDIGYVDEDGCYFYKLRLKRIIVSSGYNVYPQHIEKIIEEHKAVLKCTVIGVPHPYKIEVAKAFIVLKNGYEETQELKDDIKAHCKKNLAHYSIPHDFEFRNSIPQTLLGKVDFNRLKTEHMKNHENGVDGNEKENQEQEGSGNIRVSPTNPCA